MYVTKFYATLFQLAWRLLDKEKLDGQIDMKSCMRGSVILDAGTLPQRITHISTTRFSLVSIRCQ